ncbi:hypothetical protein ACIQGZ_17535 [Streptomyces sp. NPDC092296]|uniref:hypothetical protein n=1 Tax=Streptomyces sp. NPDC092296 TaxID=3366012 RepID=UPI00382A2EA5
MGAEAYPISHAGCPAKLRGRAAAMGAEITVSEQPPIVAGPYTTDPFVCPHGVTYWVEPTGEQIAQWVRDGVR